jgi:hypothetical protein
MYIKVSSGPESKIWKTSHRNKQKSRRLRKFCKLEIAAERLPQATQPHPLNAYLIGASRMVMVEFCAIN